MFEQLLYRHLHSFNTELSQHLAQFNGRMAIFNQEAPDDKSKGWNTESQYGRIVFAVNLQGSPDRIVSGNLMVDVVCQNGKQIPEDLERIVKPLIDGYFFTDSTQTIAASWSSSNYFTDPDKKEEGVTITYSLLAFPVQLTNDPDPIRAINEYTKELIPNSCVIGLDTTEEVWKPTNDFPAIYWRLVSIDPCTWVQSTAACEWQQATCQAHILANDKEKETAISRLLDNGFSLKKSVKLPDGTYMRVDQNIRINPGADTLQQGQVTLEATYGIIRKRQSSDVIKTVYVNGTPIT